jgi:hypothetical protein
VPCWGRDVTQRFIDTAGRCMHDMNQTVETTLAELPFEALCPGKAALDLLMERYR